MKLYCEQQDLTGELKTLGEEGYILTVTSKNIVVAANTGKGALFGLESLRQLIRVTGKRLIVPLVRVKDAPELSVPGD